MKNSRKEKPWFVYLLICSDRTIYTGITINIEERIKTHNSGRGAKYTSKRTPVELAYCEPSASHSEALRREHQIKSWGRQKKMELIESNWTVKK